MMYMCLLKNKYLINYLHVCNQTAEKARQELEKWRQQIQELHDRCQAALHVMGEFRGTSWLTEAIK